ncbi:MAG: hypothetical protein Q9210_003521 [Variospora velana]
MDYNRAEDIDRVFHKKGPFNGHSNVVKADCEALRTLQKLLKSCTFCSKDFTYHFENLGPAEEDDPDFDLVGEDDVEARNDASNAVEDDYEHLLSLYMMLKSRARRSPGDGEALAQWKEEVAGLEKKVWGDWMVQLDAIHGAVGFHEE